MSAGKPQGGEDWDSPNCKGPRAVGLQSPHTQGVGHTDRGTEGDGFPGSFQEEVSGGVFGGVWGVCV